MSNEPRRYKRRDFSGWWSGIRKHPAPKQREILEQWLKYACKTVALRGDMEQQAVVYTINKRFKNSQYGLQRYNAKRVFNIVNAKQNKYKEEMRNLKRARDSIKSNIPVEIKRRRTTKTIVSSGTAWKR